MQKKDEVRDPFLKELFDKITQAELARRLSKPGRTVTRHAINQWKRVPSHHVQTVSEITGFPLKKVRSDLYDPEARKALAAA